MVANRTRRIVFTRSVWQESGLAGKWQDSPIGQIPGDWELTTLGEICQRGGGYIQTGPFGSQLHASDYVSIGIPSIMPVNIGDNRVIVDSIAKVKKQDAERLNRHRVRSGDIIYSRRGDVERRALVRPEQDGWLCGTGCLKIDLGTGVVDPLYVSYYLGHCDVRSFISRHAVGSTMPNLNTTIMSSVPFVLPPPDQQRAIARILGALDDKIELNCRMNRALEAMAQALFKSWFVDFDPVIAKREGRKPVGMDDATAALFP
jgi:type I restriction enzyme S subunit